MLSDRRLASQTVHTITGRVVPFANLTLRKIPSLQPQIVMGTVCPVHGSTQRYVSPRLARVSRSSSC